MSKRTPGLARRARDFYPTPPEAVAPLVPHLPWRPRTYIEPCAGNGAIVEALREAWPQGSCIAALDLEPGADWIWRGDARTDPLPDCDLIITNTPWPRGGSRGEPVVSLARRFMAHAPTWLLLPWDFAANAYFAPLLPQCRWVLPVGRVSWMHNGKGGLDNAAWFHFDARHNGRPQILERRE